MDQQIYQLLYLSSATTLYTDETLLAILEKSKANNDKDGVTGLLLYYDGSILQLLEGNQQEVETVFSRIRDDGRHHSIITLIEQHVDRRSFETWSMGFRRLSSKEWNEVAGYLDDKAIKEQTTISREPDRHILNFVNSFYKTNFR